MTRPTSNAKSAAPPNDGRHRRSHDSRQRIVEAMLALVGEGYISPSAEQVSARAGVGLRSVFRHFNDMESLHEAMSCILAARWEDAARQPFVADGWQGQLLELVGRRAAIYEPAAPYLQAGQVHRFSSPVLHRNHAKFVAVLRRILIDRLPKSPPLQRGVIEAIDLLLSFEAWQRLRRDQGLSVAMAKQVLGHALQSIISKVSPKDDSSSRRSISRRKLK